MKDISIIRSELNDIGEKAASAASEMALLETETKNRMLQSMAHCLREDAKHILVENAKDVLEAKANEKSAAFIDRLTLTKERIEDMASGLEKLTTLKDPVGEVQGSWKGSQDIGIVKIRVPIGVIGIIYEARPNVTADAAGICFKTGNAVILRGSGETKKSNTAIVGSLVKALKKENGPDYAIQLLEDTSREAAGELIRMDKYLDLLIPRGGAGLIKSVVSGATVPVIETGTGNCHIYVDTSADIGMALDILINAKTQRPGVCNAAETLLVDRRIAVEFLPLAERAMLEHGVEIRSCPKGMEYLSSAKAASEDDFYTEFLDLIISVKMTEGIGEAISHINTYGTGHSEAIITGDHDNARRFTKEVDAAVVYVNASTRFTDGGMFGFGAEIGISTQKLHARGPMGLEEMTSIKYIVQGDGQTRR